jgi:hypothetical protein
MSAVEVLSMSRAAGVRIGIDGNDLLLEAATPPPPAVIDALSRNKADIIALLRRAKEVWNTEDWQAYFDERAGIFEFDGGLSRTTAEERAFEACIIEWLNRNPAPSQAGRCVWCDRPESPSAVVVPFGTEPGTHAWLHAECWPAWHASRKAYAIAALTNIAHDIEPLDGDDSGG